MSAPPAQSSEKAKASESSSQQHQRRVVRAMKVLTTHLQRLFSDMIAGSSTLAPEAKSYLEQWSTQMNVESLVEWTNSKIGLQWCSKNAKEALRLARSFWVSDATHPIPTDAKQVFSTLQESDYLFVALCLERNPESTVTFLRYLCSGRINQEHDRFKAKSTFSVYARAKTKDDDIYVAVHKPLVSASWAFSGQATTSPRLVVSDGDEYATEPIVMVPRSYQVVPRGALRKPYQTVIPLRISSGPGDTPANTSFLADCVGVAGALGGMEAAKLMLGMSSSAPLNGGVTEASLGDLASSIMPEAPRIQSRDYKKIVIALRALRDITLVIDSEHDVNLLTISAPFNPDTAHKDQRVSWALSEQIRLALLGKLEHQRLKGFNGWVLCNYTRCMKLDGRQVRAIPMYLRAASQWNASKNPETKCFDPNRMSPLILDELLLQCDAISPRTIEYLKEYVPNSHIGRSALSQDRKQGRNLLESLRERELIQSWEVEGSPDKVLILPTERDLEAMRLAQGLGSSSSDEAGIASGA